MVLKYMVTDTDLAKGELGQPETGAKQPKSGIKQPEKKVVSDWRRQTTNPTWASQSTNKNKKLIYFLMAIVTLGAVGYYLWTADLISPALDILPIGKMKVTVTAILYDEENASAIVDGSVVREGDVIEGYKVVKIHKDEVEFEKKGKRFTKKIYE
ncbi:MAG: hypothetical protein ACYSUY_14390 [Planctomycetota bacterium]|jgi:hypothetical protein